MNIKMFIVYIRKYSNFGNSLLKHSKNIAAIKLNTNIMIVRYNVIEIKKVSLS